MYQIQPPYVPPANPTHLPAPSQNSSLNPFLHSIWRCKLTVKTSGNRLRQGEGVIVHSLLIGLQLDGEPFKLLLHLDTIGLPCIRHDQLAVHEREGAITAQRWQGAPLVHSCLKGDATNALKRLLLSYIPRHNFLPRGHGGAGCVIGAGGVTVHGGGAHRKYANSRLRRSDI